MAKGRKQRLNLLEELLRSAGYTVRYERGHFRTGHCLVHERRVIVVNRFFDQEARIRKLEALIGTLEIDAEVLSEEQAGVLSDLRAANVDSP